MKTNLGWVNQTSSCFADMYHFQKFDKVVLTPPLLTMWYDNFDGDHRRTLNKYVGTLIELININGWLEIVEVLMGYWDRQRMVFRFGTAKITPTFEEIRNCIDTVGTGIERKARKQEDIFIANKPFAEDIADWLRLGKDFAYWCQESHIAFRDLYIRFGHESFYSPYNQEFKISYREWNEIRLLAFVVALLGIMVFPHGPSLFINTRVITLVLLCSKGMRTKGQQCNTQLLQSSCPICIEPWENA